MMGDGGANRWSKCAATTTNIVQVIHLEIDGSKEDTIIFFYGQHAQDRALMCAILFVS